MKYTYKDMDFLGIDCQEEITDEKLINEYNAIIDNGEELPEGIIYDYTDEVGYTFYRASMPDEEDVKSLIELKNAYSFDKIASCLEFFKTLIMVLIGISIFTAFIAFVIILTTIKGA